MRPNDHEAQPRADARRLSKRSPSQWDAVATPGIRAVTARGDAQEATGFPPRKNASGDPRGRTTSRAAEKLRGSICMASRLDSESTQGMASIDSGGSERRWLLHRPEVYAVRAACFDQRFGITLSPLSRNAAMAGAGPNGREAEPIGRADWRVSAKETSRRTFALA